METTKHNSKPPRPKRACFSFAAYANNLISRLKSSNVVVSQGLSDSEFSNIESNFNFTFPPDLRAILQQGLPITPGFPNWRSSSHQQLHILINLPASSILRRVSKTRFWHPSWGPEPHHPTQQLETVRRILKDAPTLVPIFQHCYIPSSPNVAGNPVFYVDHSGDVRLLSFDISGFFRDSLSLTEEPVWAAKKAKRIGFWSEVADMGWWWGGMEGELGVCLEGAVRRLRDGGWRDGEIREMMMVEDEDNKQHSNWLKSKMDKESMTWQVRVLSLKLLRAGWSREDVMESLGVVLDQPNSWFEYHQPQQQPIHIIPPPSTPPTK